MSKKCVITGKNTLYGNKRSHSMHATRRCFFSNLHFHRFWIENKKKFIKLRISAKGMRIIDKYGIEHFLSKI